MPRNKRTHLRDCIDKEHQTPNTTTIQDIDGGDITIARLETYEMPDLDKLLKETLW